MTSGVHFDAGSKGRQEFNLSSKGHGILTDPVRRQTYKIPIQLLWELAVPIQTT